MRLRGPDASGEWFDGEAGVCLGHRRLAIIDLDARANQPFVSSDGRYVTVYNGEIYNYRELGAELEAGGVRLRTTSDTEVALELFRRDGAAAFPKLRGMFALVIWDTEQRTLTLARDPNGIKPLYLASTPSGVLFASQVKALLDSGLVSRSVDPAGAVGFYIWGSVPEPFTAYEQIQAVPAGAVSTVKGGRVETVRFADIASAWADAESAPDDLAAVVRAALEDTVRAHLVSDVPVGVLLSGGVDSGVVAGLMAEFGQAVEGVTIAFEEFAGGGRDEVPRARDIARAYGLKHTIRPVNKAEFLADAPRILDAMDQPSIDGVNTWFGAKAIAERGYKVALSGIGGDEIFCGYDTFRRAPQLHRAGRAIALAGPLRALAAPAFAAAARLARQPKLAALPRHAGTLDGAYMLWRALLTPGELNGLLPKEMVRDGLERLELAGPSRGRAQEAGARQIAALESRRYLRNQLLRDSDWASMAHSLELRTPLVDWTLQRSLGGYATSFLEGRGKRLMAQAPRTPLPASVTEHRKTGFGLPIGDWLAEAGLMPAHVPPQMQAPWARGWACAVAESFGFPRP